MKTSFSTERRSAQHEKRTEWWRFLTVVVVSMAIFLDTVDVSIVNVALPTIKLDLHLTTTDLQWVPGVYVLTYAGFMLLGGRAADLLGRRRIFVLGAVLFGLASLSGGLANSGWLVILARGVQGIGAALTMPAATSILTTTFPEGPERNKALGIFSATGGAGFTCGLVLGGLLTTFIGWHWVFFANVPVALLIVLLARVVVPEGRSLAGAQSYDLAGAVTVTGGLLLLVYAITQANGDGATPLKTAGLFALALVLLAVFLGIEWRSKSPLIPLHIFRSRELVASCVVSFALLGSFFSYLFICTLYLQEVVRSSPISASLALVPGSIESILASQFVAPWFMNRLGLKFTISLGMFSLLSGIALFLLTGVTGNYVGVILPSTLLALFGMSMCVPSLSVAAVSGIEPSEQGLAAGLQGTLAQAGGGLGLAITASVVTLSKISAQGVAPNSASLVAAQLYGLHMGILVIVVGAASGLLIALAGTQKRSTTP
ncbi:MAG TPA: MFS transporter [Ktedonosporobacter sp.]|nr:MFS transporter [Ktedonosporobacter sp.]